MRAHASPLLQDPTAGPLGRQGRGVALALASVALWSLSGVLVRLVETAGSWEIVLYRSLVMTVTLLLVLGLRYGRNLLAPLRAAGRDAVLAGAALSGASCLFILSLAHVSVANALFMNGISPFLAAMLGWLALREPVSRVTWLGMALAVAGVATMVWGSLALDRLGGNLMALGSATSFALCSIFLRRGRQADMMPAVLWSGLISTILALGVLGATSSLPLTPSPRDLGLCALMGSLQLGLGSILYTLAARHLPAAPLQLLTLVELVLSPLWVWLVVAETPVATTLAGGALILAASILQAVARPVR